MPLYELSFNQKYRKPNSLGWEKGYEKGIIDWKTEQWYENRVSEKKKKKKNLVDMGWRLRVGLQNVAKNSIHLLTKWEGRMGKYLAWGHGSRRAVRTIW